MRNKRQINKKQWYNSCISVRHLKGNVSHLSTKCQTLFAQARNQTTNQTHFWRHLDVKLYEKKYIVWIFYEARVTMVAFLNAFSHVFMFLYVNFYKSTKNKCDETSKVQYIRFRGLNFGHACMHYENRYVLLPENKSSSTEFAMSTIFLHYPRTDKLNTASR